MNRSDRRIRTLSLDFIQNALTRVGDRNFVL